MLLPERIKNIVEISKELGKIEPNLKVKWKNRYGEHGPSKATIEKFEELDRQLSHNIQAIADTFLDYRDQIEELKRINSELESKVNDYTNRSWWSKFKELFQ